MGFKEVMALRQEGNLKDALILAREDYKSSQDQWSASAVFWVLKDLTAVEIEQGNTSQAEEYLDEMEQVVGNMGATTSVAMETLASLQKQVLPHYSELVSFSKEIQKTKNRIKVKDIFLTIEEWITQEEGLDPALHQDYSIILLAYLERYYRHITFEEFNKLSQRFISLNVVKPSAAYSSFIKLAIDAKQEFSDKLDFNALIDDWDLTNLRKDDYVREKKGNNTKSLAENILFVSTTELTVNKKDTVPESIEQLLTDLLSLYQDDLLIQLAQARTMIIMGKKEDGKLRYESLLQEIELPMAWAEYAMLVDDNEELRFGALCTALRDEKNDYLEYVNNARIELAKILIKRKEYDIALRELSFVSQICLEKSRQVPPLHKSLLDEIPGGITQSKDNRDYYYQHSRPAMEYIYRELPEVLMMVYDVMAMRLKDELSQNQVIPMLKLMTPEGKTALVTPREAGILPGDNRGRIYNVKLFERYRKHTKVVYLNYRDDIDPKEYFPTKVGIINGYNEAVNAYHVMDSDSRHHYMPGTPNEFIQGEFIKFVLLTENQQRKNQLPTPPREYLFHIERMEPNEAITAFEPLVATVEDVRNDSYLLRTERNVPSTVMHSIAPVELEVGEQIIVRGFQQRRKDKITGQINYLFITLSIEPYIG